MLKDYMGILDLNENDTNIRSLTHNRPLASIPIGGRYRIVDFILSNLVNSGIQNIGIFTKGNSRSLIDHLGAGKPWDLNRKINGLFVFNGSVSGSNDIEMLKDNMDYLYQSRQENVILASTFMLCNIDLDEAARAHEESGRDMTMIYKKVHDGKKKFIDCDVLNIDKQNRVLSVGKNIGIDDENNISMQMFIMKKETLINFISECVKTGYYNSIKDSIYRNAKKLDINAYEYKGYLSCINSIQSFYQSNMDMLDININRELFFNNGLIYTKVKDESPTKYSCDCNVINSLVANGCIIEGNVKNSIISRRVIVHKGAELNNCIIMQNCEIGENARLTNVIMDKDVIVQKDVELKGHPENPLTIGKKAVV